MKPKSPDPKAEGPTKAVAVAEGRGASLDAESARRIANASKASGFPVPAHVQDVLDAGSRPSAVTPTAAPATAAAGDDAKLEK